jgi:hypothetical protein
MFSSASLPAPSPVADSRTRTDSDLTAQFVVGNAKVHYRVHRISPLDPVLNQLPNITTEWYHSVIKRPVFIPRRANRLSWQGFHGFFRAILINSRMVTYLILIHDRFFPRLSILFLLIIFLPITVAERTLWSWVRIPHRAWMFGVCLCVFILCLFCPV